MEVKVKLYGVILVLNVIENIQAFNRFATRNKAKAFNLKEQLEAKPLIREENGKKYITEWRVGRVIRDRIVIDIDSYDINNLKTIIKSYSTLLGYSFVILTTENGYHLIAKEKSKDIQRDMVLILNPDGIYTNLPKPYIEMVNYFFQILKEEREGKVYTRTQLHEMALEFPKRFIAAGLFSGYGNFDILHAVNGLMRGKYVLRISKKNKNDKIEEVKI